MNRTDRLYAIVETLRAASSLGRTCAWLAERFEVSTRTIKRDIRALVEAGVPVVSFDGRGAGYSLHRNASLPPLAFTGGEAIAIAIALAAEPQLPFGLDGRAALTKVVAAMTPTQKDELGDLAHRVWMRVPTPRARPTSARTIDEAIRQKNVVLIDYVDGRGNRTSGRPIEPMALARTFGHWYVLAWCRRQRAGRWFRLDRIPRARPTREAVRERSLTDVFGEPPDDAKPVELVVQV